MTVEQLSIALAKLYMGSGPGDEMWSELDYQALEFSLGHPVARKRREGDGESLKKGLREAGLPSNWIWDEEV